MTAAIDRLIRVLLVHDHAVVRRGLGALIEREPGIEVVGEAYPLPWTVDRSSLIRSGLFFPASAAQL